MVSFWHLFNDSKFANKFEQKHCGPISDCPLKRRVINCLFLSNMFHFSCSKISVSAICLASNASRIKIVNTDQFILLEVLSGPTILGSSTKVDDSLTNSIKNMTEHSYKSWFQKNFSIGFPCQSAFRLFYLFIFGEGAVKRVGKVRENEQVWRSKEIFLAL